MARVVGEREIPLGSVLYQQGLAQFRANLADLLARYREAGVPVYIRTLVSNERDQPPFLSGLAEETDAASWQRAYGTAQAALEKGDLDEALRAADRVVALDAGSADAHFLLGRVLDARGEYRAARVEYLAAKDRDLLRFRAPEAMNGIIREQAETYGAIVVETQRAFLRASPQHIIGDELILEHLHPNARGYFLLADAFYDALAVTGLGGSWKGAATSDAEEQRRSSITAVDRIAGEDRIALLEANWPFQRDASEVVFPEIVPRTRIERIAYRMAKRKTSWTEAMQKALGYYRAADDYEEAARIALNLAETYPLAAAQRAEAGQLLAALGRYREAETHLALAPRLAPHNRSVAAALGELRGHSEQACGSEDCE